MVCLGLLIPMRGVAAEAKKGDAKSGPAPGQADEKLAAGISKGIAAAEPAQYVVLLRDCIGEIWVIYRLRAMGATVIYLVTLHLEK